VRAGNRQHGFSIPPFARTCLLEGLDEIGITQKHLPEILAFEVSTGRA
jgi:3-isopropylmalate dehydratase small subunit